MEKTVEIESLEQVLQVDAVETAPQQTQEEGKVETSRDDTVPTTGDAKDFSAALNKRVEKERQKLEEEVAAKYKADVEFAKQMRQMRGNKADQEILTEAFDSSVKSYAQENGVPETVARELLALKMRIPVAPEPTPPPTPEADPNEQRLNALALQANEISESDGIDIIAVIGADPVMKAKVASGEWDINRAYAYHMSSTAKRTPPVTRSSNMRETHFSIANMTKEQFGAVDQRLTRGEKIKLA